MITITITLESYQIITDYIEIFVLHIVLTLVIKREGSLQFYTYIMPYPILLFLK